MRLFSRGWRRTAPGGWAPLAASYHRDRASWKALRKPCRTACGSFKTPLQQFVGRNGLLHTCCTVHCVFKQIDPTRWKKAQRKRADSFSQRRTFAAFPTPESSTGRRPCSRGLSRRRCWSTLEGEGLLSSQAGEGVVGDRRLRPPFAIPIPALYTRTARSVAA